MDNSPSMEFIDLKTQQNRISDKREHSFILKIGIVIYIYTLLTALSVQLIILPYVFPEFHAGNGLIADGDWVLFNQIAIELSDEIKVSGWKAWELRPSGQAPAGIAAAIYSIILPKPWVLLPFNALLFSLSAIMLFKITRYFVSPRGSILALLPFVAFPSALTWNSMLHKDSLFILGNMCFLFGMIAVTEIEKWRTHQLLMSARAGFIVLGALLVWVVRPYAATVMFTIGSGIMLLPTFYAVYCMVMKRIIFSNFLKYITIIIFTFACIFLVLSGDRKNNSGEVKTNLTLTIGVDRKTSLEKKTSSWIPEAIEHRILALLQERSIFLEYFADAATNIDPDVELTSVSDLIMYLPRATSNMLLSPYPNQWFYSGSSTKVFLERMISGFEMCVVYVTLPFIFFAVFRWRNSLKAWIIILYSFSMGLIYVVAIPNVGTLYRMRYAFLMTLVAFGVAGLVRCFEIYWRGSGKRLSQK